MAQVLPAKRPRGLSHRHQLPSDNPVPRMKRARLSTEPSVEPSEASHIQDADSNSPEDEHSEVERGEGEHEDEDAAWLRATQIVAKTFRKVTHSDNTPAENGIIEEIGCTNFMCHAKLTVRLGPLINFIIGHNGSGKSAVLTALTLCLGAKATATNRGQSLKSFIKAGEHFSILSVKIKNQGSGAYKPEQYGDSILVERHFTDTGSSNFKLKDRNGKIVSNKKSELEDIIDHFGLQIDNPLNVLTQDMARQFLNDSNAKDKYKFFLKGTQLETLDRDYSQIEQELEEQKSKSQTLETDTEALRKRFEQLYKKSQAARGLEKLRLEEQKIERQGAWAYVAADEREAAEVDRKISELSEDIDRRQQAADTASEKFARVDKALEDSKTTTTECEGELSSAQDAEKEAKINFDTARETLITQRNAERQLKVVIDKLEKKKGDTQSQIETLRQAQADGGQHEQNSREFEDAKAAYEECKNVLESHVEKLTPLKQELRAAQENYERAVPLVKNKQHEENISRNKIQTLQKGQREWTDAYPNPKGLVRLLQAIQEERRFRDRPVGPLGHYIELKDPNWSSILERSFGGVLNAFIVTNKADHSILSAMMKRLSYQASINIVNKTGRIDTSNHEPDRQLLTIDRVLKINNNVVRNSLLANQYIEQIVLIRDRKEASELGHSNRDARLNVKAIYCWSDQGRRVGHSITPSNTGTVSFNPIEEYRGSSRMHADQGHQIQDEKETLDRIRRELGDLKLKEQAAQQEVQACEAKIRQHRMNNKDLKDQHDRTRQDMDRLEEEVAATVPNSAPLEEMENELKGHEEALVFNNEQFEDLIGPLDEAKKLSKDCYIIVDNATKAVEALKAKVEECKARTHSLTLKREQALRQKNTAIEQVQEIEENRDKWQQRHDELETHLAVHTEEASKICARVDVPEGATFEKLMQELEAKKKIRADLEKQLGGSQQELAQKANTARKTWHEAERYVKDMTVVRNSLANALKNRKVRWKHFRDDISVRARVTFTHLLSERRFQGQLQVDHNKKALEMGVQPDINVKDGTNRQTKTLSGGEKSFATICLLLALWDAMGSPIRCLDEFDVFMDSVNREISMDMIIQAARRAVGRQYILITPQAMNNKSVKSMTDVTVIKMSDPERGQTALNFAR